MYAYKNITTASTVVIAPGPAELGTINVNTGAASAVVTVYDSLAGSGVKIATVDASSKSSQAFCVRTIVGLTVVMAGGNADVTIGYA